MSDDDFLPIDWPKFFFVRSDVAAATKSRSGKLFVTALVVTVALFVSAAFCFVVVKKVGSVDRERSNQSLESVVSASTVE